MAWPKSLGLHPSNLGRTFGTATSDTKQSSSLLSPWSWLRIMCVGRHAAGGWQERGPERQDSLILQLHHFPHSQFPTPEAVLEGARYMVALQIAREPLVRQVLRQTFQERAKLNITPTKKGRKVSGVKGLDSSHGPAL